MKTATITTSPGRDIFNVQFGMPFPSFARLVRLCQSTPGGFFRMASQLWNTAIKVVLENWRRLKTSARRKDARPSNTSTDLRVVGGTEFATQENRQPTKCSQRRALTNCPLDGLVLGQPQMHLDRLKPLGRTRNSLRLSYHVQGEKGAVYTAHPKGVSTHG